MANGKRKALLIWRDSRGPSDCRKIRSHGSSECAASGHDWPARHKYRALSAWWPTSRTASDRILRRIGHHRNGTPRLASLTSTEEKKVREFLEGLVVCELTPSIRGRAVELRREQHLKLPDAIVCATAMELGVELWTNDTSLVKVPGLACRTARLLTA